EVGRARLDRGDSEAARPLAQIAALASEAVDSLTDMVWSINPKNDRFSDLLSRVRHFAGEFLAARDIELQFRVSEGGGDTRIGAEARRQLLLTAKEALNNLARHSGASEARIEFAVNASDVVLRVSDNGKGFHAATVAHGNGLLNMSRRAAML